MKQKGRKILQSKSVVKPQITDQKKKILMLITILLPFVLIGLLEISLRLINYGGNRDLFVSIPDETSKYYGINLEIAKRYFNTVGHPTPRKDLFLKEKPKNGYRIFVLGESTAAGFPYGNNLSFPRILNRRLSDAFPDKHIEVVNTGITAINSYAQLDFMDEILEQKPDAILIYSGHNEYYGALGVGSMESFGKGQWLVRLNLTFQKFKTYLLVKDILAKIVGLFGSPIEDQGAPSATLMERIVKNKIIPFRSEDYELGKEQFNSNIRDIVQKAKDAGVKVIISELVSNVKDNKPFESVKSGGFPEAQKIFEQAVDYEKAGRYEEARKAYYQAKDLDALRFRAPEDFNKIIHQAAADLNIPLVSMESYFENNSPNKLIGDNLMHEHLHPNSEGYFLMADAFFNTMRANKFISSEWPSNSESSTYYKNNWGFTKLDSMYAILSVVRLKDGWPFVKGQGVNVTLSNYRHHEKADSIAAFIINTGQMTLEQGHIALGEYYQRVRDYESAFKEYNALIYTVPYFSLFYEPAVKILITIKNYDKALDVLLQWVKYEETGFANQWIGQIYLVKNETTLGVPYLEKALGLGIQDLNLYFNLSRAYYETGQWQKGDDLAGKLRGYTSDPFYTTNLQDFKITSQSNFKKAAELNSVAQGYIKKNDDKKAEEILLKSLSVKQTQSANEMLGQIYLQRGNNTKAKLHLEKARAFSSEQKPAASL